jgi:Lrp/AsnC family transcriptional regulator, regulator for asnA, asnC and gidA
MSSRRTDNLTVDQVDETIIALLEEDGRRSYGEIGRAVGLSEAGARQRVNRLRESGLMRIVAISDPLRLGRAVVATVGIRVGGDPRVVAERLALVESIEWVVITAGSFDLLVEIVCRSEAELVAIIAEQIRSKPEVRETETFMHLHTEKNVFAWGQRLNRSPQPRRGEDE